MKEQTQSTLILLATVLTVWGTLGYSVWNTINYNSNKHKIIPFTQELNGDSNLDLVATPTVGEPVIYLGQGDGTYKSLEEIYDKNIFKLKSEQEMMQIWKKSIENKVRGKNE